MRCSLLHEECWVTQNLATEVRGRVFDVQLQEDGIFHGDLRGHTEPQKGIHKVDRGRTQQLGCGYDGQSHALPYHRLNIVLGDDARPREDLEQPPRLGERKLIVKTEVAGCVHQREPARGASDRQVEEKWDRRAGCTPAKGRIIHAR